MIEFSTLLNLSIFLSLRQKSKLIRKSPFKNKPIKLFAIHLIKQIENEYGQDGRESKDRKSYYINGERVREGIIKEKVNICKHNEHARLNRACSL